MKFWNYNSFQQKLKDFTRMVKNHFNFLWIRMVTIIGLSVLLVQDKLASLFLGFKVFTDRWVLGQKFVHYGPRWLVLLLLCQLGFWGWRPFLLDSESSEKIVIITEDSRLFFLFGLSCKSCFKMLQHWFHTHPIY